MRTSPPGQTLAGVPDIGLLLLTTRDNRPVYVRDVAEVVIGPSPQETACGTLTPAKGGWERDAGGQPRARQARRRQRRRGRRSDR